MASTDPGDALARSTHPVLLTYDGTDLAAHAIAEAGAQLTNGSRAPDARERVRALVLCVWQPADVGFIPSSERHFDAASAAEVKSAAEETAAYGASLAQKAGFDAHSITAEGAPIWAGILEVADAHEASLVVLGARRRRGLSGHLLGSVAASVSAHAKAPVLLVPEQIQSNGN